MTKPLSYCRKRCRSNCEEEVSEFMPLSKRINNLHINNTLLNNTTSPTVDSHQSTNCQESINNFSQIVDRYHPLGIDTVDSSQWNGNGVINHNLNQIGGNEERCNTQIQGQPFYNPDLTQAENPYYFENNRLLFTLYMERLQRTASSNNQL